MKDSLGKSEDILVGIEELQRHLLGPTDVAGIITVFAKNACDGRYRRFAFIGKSEGNVVAAAGRFAECHCVQKAAWAQTEKYEQLLETIEYLKTPQIGLVTIMQRKNRMVNGAQEAIQNRLLKEGFFHLEEKLTDVDGDLLGATAELNRLNVGKVELEERRVSDVSRVVLNQRTMSGFQNSGGETGLSDATASRCPKALGVGLSQGRGSKFCEQCWRFAEKEDGSGAEGVDTREYESCQQQDMDVDEARRN